ncbi:MAG: hypothetical protein PVJ86_02695 [Phycisphaerales bacterium]|jgi:hypothetical protein
MLGYRNERTEEARAFWVAVDKAAAKVSEVSPERMQEIGDEWLDSPTSIVPERPLKFTRTKKV